MQNDLNKQGHTYFKNYERKIFMRTKGTPEYIIVAIGKRINNEQSRDPSIFNVTKMFCKIGRVFYSREKNELCGTNDQNKSFTFL